MSIAAFSMVAIVVVVGCGIWTHNRFVALRQRAANAFSDVDVQLKRRWDLVPPLVEVVRGYAGHERDVMDAVVAARSRAMNAGDQSVDPAHRGECEADLARALRQIFVVVENYPVLRADRNFLDLQGSLVAIEDDIQHARRYHNAVVRDLNTLRQSIPAAAVGALTGVRLHEFFQLDGEERAAPRVNLDPGADNTRDGDA